jgi:hypothetical protein
MQAVNKGQRHAGKETGKETVLEIAEEKDDQGD